SEALAGGHRTMLVDAGDAGRRLLRAVQRAAPTPAVGELLGAAPSTSTDTPWGLSPRELEVVRYLRQPLAGGEIAQELFISLNTLKTHLRTIYRKLGVDGREQAVRLVEQSGAA